VAGAEGGGQYAVELDRGARLGGEAVVQHLDLVELGFAEAVGHDVVAQRVAARGEGEREGVAGGDVAGVHREFEQAPCADELGLDLQAPALRRGVAVVFLDAPDAAGEEAQRGPGFVADVEHGLRTLRVGGVEEPQGQRAQRGARLDAQLLAAHAHCGGAGERVGIGRVAPERRVARRQAQGHGDEFERRRARLQAEEECAACKRRERLGAFICFVQDVQAAVALPCDGMGACERALRGRRHDEFDRIAGTAEEGVLHLDGPQGAEVDAGHGLQRPCREVWIDVTGMPVPIGSMSCSATSRRRYTTEGRCFAPRQVHIWFSCSGP
jgi:hypothetical protein